MSVFAKSKKGGIADVIRCDESEYLVWKWHPNGIESGKSKRENAIRTTSILRVKNGEVAVFVYKKDDGTIEDYIVGPYEQTISTKNFPVLSSIIGLWYEGDTPFQAEVYFINLAQTNTLKFGIPFFNIVDPRFADFEVPVAVRGSITFGISDYKKFVKLHRLIDFSFDDLKQEINDAVVRFIKDYVINAVKEFNIPIIGIESQISSINEKVEPILKERVSELFGISINTINISSLDVDKDSEAYAELKSITKDLTRRQAEANMTNFEERLRIQREEEQFAQHMATKQQNIGVLQLDVQAQVGVAGAEALGKMGENGAGNIDIGNGGGYNPAAMMAGIAVGSAVGQNVVGTMNSAMNITSVTPPPVPTVKFYLAKDGKATGPYDVETLKGMIGSGLFSSTSLVWKEGMTNWARADSIPEFIGAFPPTL